MNKLAPSEKTNLYNQGEMRCPCCGETKPLSFFGRDKNCRFGTACWCLECSRLKSISTFRKKTGYSKPYKPYNRENRTLGSNRLETDGYVSINIGNGKWRAEHRVVFEKYLGRTLKTHEQVHHINGMKSDNRLQNLFLMDMQNHSRKHFNILRENARMRWEIHWLKQEIERLQTRG